MFVWGVRITCNICSHCKILRPCVSPSLNTLRWSKCSTQWLILPDKCFTLGRRRVKTPPPYFLYSVCFWLIFLIFCSFELHSYLGFINIIISFLLSPCQPTQQSVSLPVLIAVFSFFKGKWETSSLWDVLLLSSSLVYLCSPSLSHFKAAQRSAGSGSEGEEGLAGVTIITWLMSSAACFTRGWCVCAWPFFIPILQNPVSYFKECRLVSSTPSGERERDSQTQSSGAGSPCDLHIVVFRRGQEAPGGGDWRGGGWCSGTSVACYFDIFCFPNTLTKGKNI